MSNGDTIHEIRELLAEGKAIPTKTALRLSLAAQSEIYDKFAETLKSQQAAEKRIDKLERNSIVFWIQGHPKLATTIITIYIFLAPHLNAIVAKALGVK
jgi:hypothetical protein